MSLCLNCCVSSLIAPGTLRHSDAGNPYGQGGATTGGMELDDFQEGFCS